MKVLPEPQRIVLELTAQCNLACPMCPRHYITACEGYMPVQMWRKAIDEIASFSVTPVVLPFWRGESLLHPDFCSMMAYALAKGTRIHMCTNAHVMSQEQLRCLIGLEFVTISLHSREGWENARLFVRACAGKKRSLTQVSFVDCEELGGFYLKELLADGALGGFDSVRMYREHTIGGVFGKSDGGQRRALCPKLMDTLVIAADGSVSRCNHQWVPEASLSLRDLTLRQIWASERVRAIRDDYPDAACAACDQWQGHTQGERWQMKNGLIVHEIFAAGNG